MSRAAMFKLTEETTARQRYPSIDINFVLEYENTPISVTFNGKKIRNTVTHQITKLDQQIKFVFNGFVPKDTKQKVCVSITHNNEYIECNTISKFKMINNMYIDNKVIDNYNEIHFNGELTLTFNRKWVECNILKSGCVVNTKEEYLYMSKDYNTNKMDRNRPKCLNAYDLICAGSSFTHGTDMLKPKSAWPALLEEMTRQTVANFGVEGLDHYSLAQNVKYIINKIKTKKIVVLKPISVILPYRFPYIDGYKYMFTSNENFELMFPKFYKKWMAFNFKKENVITKIIEKKFKEIEQLCLEKEIDLTILEHGYFDYNKSNVLENKHPNEICHKKFAEKIMKLL